MSFGEKIKELRIKNNLTQQDLADKFFVTRQAVSRWEQDKSIPNIDVLELIAKEFNVSIDYLISNDENNYKKEENDETEEDKTFKSSVNSTKYNLLMKITFYSILNLIVIMVIFVLTYYTVDSIKNESYAIYASSLMLSKDEVKNNKSDWLSIGGNYYLSSDEGSWFIYSCHEISGDVEIEFIEEIFSTNDNFGNDLIISKKCTFNGIDTTFNYYRVPDIIEIYSFNIYGTFLTKVIFSKEDIINCEKYHCDGATSYTIKAYYDDKDTRLFEYRLGAEYGDCMTSIYISSSNVGYVLNSLRLF